MIKLVDLAARHAAVAPQAEEAALRVLRSGRYVGDLDEVEVVASRWLGREGAVGVGSGTDALMLALQAVDVAPEDEVIVPALSFFASAGAVAALGAVPVLVDVREDGLLDPSAVAKAVTSRTAAVIPVHLFGNLAPELDLDLAIVDDAAQALGRHPTGVLSTLSCYPTKIWGAAGDGGFVAGDDPELLRKVRRLGHHGAQSGHIHERVGGWVGRNCRLDPLQAAVLLAHAEALPTRIARRRQIADRYDASLPPGWLPLHRQPESPVQQYCVLVPDRDAVQQSLLALGVQTRVYYRRSLAQQPALARRHPTPVADQLCTELLALPCHAQLSDADVAQVLAALHRVATARV